MEKSNEADLLKLKDEQFDDSSQEESLECLVKASDCKSKECERFEKCTGQLKSHCFTITNAANQTDNEIVMAGCWSGTIECHSPSEMLQHFNKKTSEWNGDAEFRKKFKNFKISDQLLSPDIQNKCINYAQANNEYFIRTNQSFCCCASSRCNSRIIFKNERNPSELYNLQTVGSTFKPVISSQVHGSNHMNGQEIAVIFLSTSITFILLSLFVLLLFKKKFFFRTKYFYLPSIFFSKRTNSFSSSTHQHLQQQQQQQQQHQHQQQKFEIQEETGNNRIYNPINNPASQPLLMHPEQPVVMSIIAPNVEIVPESINFNGPKPTLQHFFYNDNNNHFLIDKDNDSEVNLPLLAADKQQDFSSHPNYLSDPKPLRASDLTLIEQVAMGQFSTVWKACLTEQQQQQSQTNEENSSIQYAIKIFNSSQRTAWSNEKDIYSCLITLNENILKYFSSDQVNNSNNMHNDMPAFLCNEYWLITEYHSYGSLHDFLKAHCCSWKQMISLCYSFFEGLAYLHSENSEPQKTFAIAHRDLKSKNILVKKDAHTCCIADFGLALKLEKRSKLSSVEIRSKVGTRRYMSPELIEGAIAFTKETFLRIDVYASALVLWEIISRGDFYEELSEYKLPFEDEVGFNPSIEDMKELVVDKCHRPTIKPEWLREHSPQMKLIVQTIEECWDIDLDARISAECAASRIRKIFKNIF